MTPVRILEPGLGATIAGPGPAWQADRATRTALAMVAGMATLMCLPDHFDWNTWPFTFGYMILYGAALGAIWTMRPGEDQETGTGGRREDECRWRDLGPGLRRSRLLAAGLSVAMWGFYPPHWIHSPDVTGAACLAGVLVVLAILLAPGSVRLGSIAVAAIFLLIFATPLEYTNHVFLPVKGVIGHVTISLGFAALAAAAILPVRVRWVLVGILVLGTLLRIESLVQWPMDPLRRDMPVLMNLGIDTLLEGRFPYRPFFCSHDVPQTYLPMLYLTDLPFVAAGLDMRWGQMTCALVTALAIWGWGRGTRGTREIGLFLSVLFYMMPESIWSVVHAEPPPYWMWGALFLGAVIHRRYLLAAIFLGITLGSRHFAFLFIPFAIIWYASLVRSRREALLYLLVAAAITCAIVMPFALRGPIPFVFGTFHWLNRFGETHRTWWWIYISFAPVFYQMNAERFLPWIQASTFAVSLALALVFDRRGFLRHLDLASASWRPWWFLAWAYIMFLMFNSLIWRYLHAMPIILVTALVAMKVQASRSPPPSGSPAIGRLVARGPIYALVAGSLATVFVASLAYMGWAYARSRDRESLRAHAIEVQRILRPGDLLVDQGLFNTWPVMQGAVFKGRELPGGVRYVVRLRSQFPPMWKRVLYFDGSDLFVPSLDAKDILGYMRYTGHYDGKRSRLHIFENPHATRIFWRLAMDLVRLKRVELTASPVGVALGQRRPGDRFFFHGAAPPGYFAGWHMIRSMFHRWTCVLAIPPGKGRELRFHIQVPEQGDGWLVTGLDDFALWASRPAVTLRLEGPGLPPGGESFVNPNEQGLFVWSTGPLQAGEYTATVTAPRPHQRIFCFDLALGHPASGDGPGDSGGIGM